LPPKKSDIYQRFEKLLTWADGVRRLGVRANADQPDQAEIAYGFGEADFAVNRREPTPRGVRIGVNPNGPTDREVPVLTVTGPGGTLAHGEMAAGDGLIASSLGHYDQAEYDRQLEHGAGP